MDEYAIVNQYITQSMHGDRGSFHAAVLAISYDMAKTLHQEQRSPASQAGPSLVTTTTLPIGLAGMLGNFEELNVTQKILLLKFVLARTYGEAIGIDIDAWGKAYLEDKELYQSVLDRLPRTATHLFQKIEPHTLLASDPKDAAFHVERFARRFKANRETQPDLSLVKAIADYLDLNALWTTPPASEADRQLFNRLHENLTGQAPDERFAREALTVLRIERENHKKDRVSMDHLPPQVDAEIVLTDYLSTHS